MDRQTFLVLCEETDLDALWAWRGLRQLGLGRVELVTAGMLASSIHWSHTVGQGDAGVKIVLADGRVIRSEEIAGALNRLTHIPLHAAGASDIERSYAEQEWSAFSVSWLYSLTKIMLNRPVPQGLCGAHRHHADWTWLAVQAGLRVFPCQLAASGTATAIPLARSRVWVVGESIVGNLAMADETMDACRRLAASAGCTLLGLEFVSGTDGIPRFASATATPLLHPGGGALLAALATALRAAP